MLLSKFSKSLMGLLIGFGLMACGGGSGSSVSVTPGTPGGSTPPPAASPKSVVLKSNGGLSCFALSSGVWCRGTHGNFPSVLPLTFTQIVSARVSGLNLWDDTLCFEAQALTTPIDRDEGTATYCMGEATFSGLYVFYSVLYGTGFTGFGSSDVMSSENLISGGDLTLLAFMGAGIVTDSSALVSSQTLSCSQSGTTLTCPTFTAQVQ
jgi:hypothetical protein